MFWSAVGCGARSGCLQHPAAGGGWMIPGNDCKSSPISLSLVLLDFKTNPNPTRVPAAPLNSSPAVFEAGEQDHGDLEKGSHHSPLLLNEK